jgi:hypothetical protein
MPRGDSQTPAPSTAATTPVAATMQQCSHITEAPYSPRRLLGAYRSAPVLVVERQPGSPLRTSARNLSF